MIVQWCANQRRAGTENTKVIGMTMIFAQSSREEPGSQEREDFLVWSMRTSLFLVGIYARAWPRPTSLPRDPTRNLSWNHDASQPDLVAMHRREQLFGNPQGESASLALDHVCIAHACACYSQFYTPGGREGQRRGKPVSWLRWLLAHLPWRGPPAS